MNPDSQTQVEDLEKILKSRKQINQLNTLILQRSISLSPDPVKEVDGIKFNHKF